MYNTGLSADPKCFRTGPWPGTASQVFGTKRPLGILKNTTCAFHRQQSRKETNFGCFKPFHLKECNYPHSFHFSERKQRIKRSRRILLPVFRVIQYVSKNKQKRYFCEPATTYITWKHFSRMCTERLPTVGDLVVTTRCQYQWEEWV